VIHSVEQLLVHLERKEKSNWEKCLMKATECPGTHGRWRDPNVATPEPQLLMPFASLSLSVTATSLRLRIQVTSAASLREVGRREMTVLRNQKPGLGR
jgi:hypothetical protein